jgi:hypothetical protein
MKLSARASGGLRGRNHLAIRHEKAQKSQRGKRRHGVPREVLAFFSRVLPSLFLCTLRVLAVGDYQRHEFSVNVNKSQ